MVGKRFRRRGKLGTTIAFLLIRWGVALLLGNTPVLPKRRKHCEGSAGFPPALALSIVPLGKTEAAFCVGVPHAEVPQRPVCGGRLTTRPGYSVR